MSCRCVRIMRGAVETVGDEYIDHHTGYRSVTTNVDARLNSFSPRHFEKRKEPFVLEKNKGNKRLEPPCWNNVGWIMCRDTASRRASSASSYTQTFASSFSHNALQLRASSAIHAAQRENPLCGTEKFKIPSILSFIHSVPFRPTPSPQHYYLFHK
jgi:hypothetical protein